VIYIDELLDANKIYQRSSELKEFVKEIPNSGS
jgi:hypothetical protein